MDLYSTILKSVSRSFYLSLRVLPARVRPVMSLGYLLCRAADSIADTDAVPKEDRLKTLEKFRGLFETFPVPPAKLKEFVSQLPQDESLSHLEACLTAFNSSSKTDQALLQRVVLGVIAGMEMDLKTFGDSAETLTAFPTAETLETYIGYVAGEPGRFWTNVLLQHGLLPDGAMRDGLLNDGFEFGKGLQMINILKDMQDDLARGRCYIPLTLLKERGLSPADLLTDKADQTFLPLYHELLKQTVSRLRRGLDYLKRLPTWDFRLRAAVWWPLAIGLATLSRLRAADARKITRGQVYRILGSSVLYMPSDRLLRWEFERLAEDVQPSLY